MAQVSMTYNFVLVVSVELLCSFNTPPVKEFVGRKLSMTVGIRINCWLCKWKVSIVSTRRP